MKAKRKRAIAPTWAAVTASVAVCLCFAVDTTAQAIGGGNLIVRLPPGEEVAVARSNLGSVIVQMFQRLDEDLCGHGSTIRTVPEEFARFGSYPVKINAAAQGPVELRIFVGGPLIASRGPDGGWHTEAEVNGLSMNRRNASVWEYREILYNPTATAPDFNLALRIDYEGMLDVLARMITTETRRPAGCGIHASDLEGLESGLTIDYLSRVDVTAMLIPLEDECRMTAEVSGDVSGHYFGAVAFFNEHRDGIAKGFAGGSMGDRKMWELADSAIPGMDDCAAIIQLSEQFGTTPPEACTDPDSDAAREQETFAEFINQELTGDDTFGLSLIDMKGDNLDGTAELSGLTALLGAGFTLNLSGQKEGGYGAYRVSPSLLSVAPGSVSGLGGIKFELQKPGNAEILLQLPESQANLPDGQTPSIYYGSVSADLETSGSYTVPGTDEVRPLKIHLEAKFNALEGSTACLK